MKKHISHSVCAIVSLILTFTILLGLAACSPAGGQTESAVKKKPIALEKNETAIYISPDGNDENDGSFEKPFKSFKVAQKKLRDINSDMKGNIYLVFREGVYTEKISLYQTDSGENGFEVVLMSYPNETVEIYGGKEISGFKKVKGEDYYKTVLKDVKSVRQFYVNGITQKRATSTTRILPYDWLNGEDKDGFLIKTEYLQKVKNTGGLELRLSYEWQDFILPVKGIRKCSDTLSCVYVEDLPAKMYAASSDSATEMASGLLNEISLENSVDFVNEPGEWAFDKTTGELWYYPAEGIDMETAVFEIPERQDLLTIEGLDNGMKAHDITVKGLNFRISAWDTPTDIGFVSWQADAYWENLTVYPNVTYASIKGSVRLLNCNNVTIKENSFKNMGGTAITGYYGVSDSKISQNSFSDCAAGAISIGNHRQGTITIDDEKNPLCNKISIDNNSVYRMGQSYYSTVGIQVFYGSEIDIAHNDIINVANSGISVGWGWNTELVTTTEKIRIRNNKILFHSMMARDSGGIYTLGIQHQCVLEENYIKDNGYTQKGIYHDQGTANYTDSRNVLDLKFASYWTNDYSTKTKNIVYYDNYTSIERHTNRSNSVHNNTVYVLDRNWPKQARDIIMNCGVSATSGNTRAVAFGLPADKLSAWFTSDNGVKTDDSKNVTEWLDYSGNEHNAKLSKGTASWEGYASNENHAIKLSADSALNLEKIKEGNTAFGFVAKLGKNNKLSDVFRIVGITLDDSQSKVEAKKLNSSVSSFIYTTTGKKGTLYQNGEKVAEWKRNAPVLSDKTVIGNTEALLFDIMYFNSELNASEIISINKYFNGKYTLSGPTQESLLLWLDASKLVSADKDGYVSAWGDIAERRLGGLVQSNKENMPKLVKDGINGKPSVLFDGKNDWLYNYSTRWVGEEVTMFIVSKLEKTSVQTFGSVNGIKEFLAEINEDGVISVGDNLPDRVSTHKDCFKFGKTQLLTYQRYPRFEEITPADQVWLSTLPGTIMLYNNNKLLGEYSHYTRKNDTEWGGFALGNKESNTLNGMVSEVLIYDRILNEDERNNVTEYLRGKYAF